MTVVIPVSADWLSLREPVDGRSRSQTLAEEAARMLHPPLVVHDLGSGTGSMMRWLAPRLPGPQTWVLHDWNADLLRHAAASGAHDAAGEAVRVQCRAGELGGLTAGSLRGASLVVSSALLDVLAADEVAAIVGACVSERVPVLFVLTVTGRVELEPVDPLDDALEAAFNAHQRREVHGRRLLGPDAAGAVTALFRDAGWSVSAAASPWVLDAADAALTAEWLDGWVAAAVEQRPALAGPADAYLRARTAQLRAGVLRVVVHHEDVRAWPP